MNNNKHFVQEIIPSAFCVDVNHTFIIYGFDAENRQYVVGHSACSEEDAWEQVAETFRQKMLAKLESE
jgi:hypothetical protein